MKSLKNLRTENNSGSRSLLNDNAILNKVLDKFKKFSDEDKLIILYRYLSLLIISFFYLFDDYSVAIKNKFYIIIPLFLSSVILNRLYIYYKESASGMMLLILIETLSNAVILAPSGGIRSPFVWYSLNTILLAAFRLKRKYYCWLILAFYLITSTTINCIVFPINEFGVFEQLRMESNVILSLFMITIIIQILSKHMETIKVINSNLMKSNEQLNIANLKIKTTINQVIDLYQAVHLLRTQNDKKSLIGVITLYTERITNADMIIYFDYLLEEEMIIRSSKISDSKIHLIDEIFQEIRNRKTTLSDPEEITRGDLCLRLFPVKSTYKTYGILAINAAHNIDSSLYRDNYDQMIFLAGLGAIVLEKFELETVKNRFLIVEEQNRIANELHDSVIQRLFSTSTGIYKLMKTYRNISFEEIDLELSDIQMSIDSIMREIRETIYSLSSEKNGNNSFEGEIRKYVSEVSNLNGVDVILNICGRADQLNIVFKKALYRIICEGIGNAVRHGKATKIEIDLDVSKCSILLNIHDNGIGFNITEIESANKSGLGLKNIRALASMMKGEVRIESIINEGTLISVSVPEINS